MWLPLLETATELTRHECGTLATRSTLDRLWAATVEPQCVIANTAEAATTTKPFAREPIMHAACYVANFEQVAWRANLALSSIPRVVDLDFVKLDLNCNSIVNDS
jgi:hypothetical protein